MTIPPYVMSHQLGPQTWYVVSAEFPTSYMAKQTWERIERKLRVGTLGIYRHGIEGGNEGRVISAVTRDADEAQRVCNLLSVGVHFPLDEDNALAMIARRARVVLDASRSGASSGRLKWRRPEGKGAILDRETGEMIEPDPGQG